MTLLDILLVILIIAAIALCVYLIISLKNMNETLNSIQNDIHNLSEKTIPILDNLDDTSKRINQIAAKAENHFNDFSNSIENFRDKIYEIGNDFTASFSSPKSDKPQVFGLIKTLSGISKGIFAFWRKLKG